MTGTEPQGFTTPRNLEEAQQLVEEARRLRARGEDLHDQALGSAIRVALRDVQRLTAVPDVLNITYAQARRYVGRDDVSLLPINFSAAADYFFRYLPEIELDDISWVRGDHLLVQPTPATQRVKDRATRDGRQFPWNVRDIGEGLLNLGVVTGEGTHSSVTRTHNGVKRKVWVIERAALDDLESVWSPDFADPLARALRAIDQDHEEPDRDRGLGDSRTAAQELLLIIRAAGASEFGIVRGDRVLLHPAQTISRATSIATHEGRSFPHSTRQISEGLSLLGVLPSSSGKARTVGRRIDGKLVRVWDVALSAVT